MDRTSQATSGSNHERTARIDPPTPSITSVNQPNKQQKATIVDDDIPSACVFSRGGYETSNIISF